MEDFIKAMLQQQEERSRQQQEEARANRQQQQEESQANRQLQQAMLQQQEERSRQQQAMLQQQEERSRQQQAMLQQQEERSRQQQAMLQQQQAESRAMLQQQEERSRQQQAESRAMLQQQQAKSRAMFQLMMEKFSGVMAAPQATTTEGSHTGLQGYPVVQHSARAAVQKALQKMTATDDVEAYLTVFERVAEREELPAEQWADVLAPFLTGESQKAYYDLSETEAREYPQLKAEILARLGVTVQVRSSRVHQWAYSEKLPPRSQMHDLIHLVRKWLQPDDCTPAQMVERVVLDKFTRSLPSRLQRWVGQAGPTNAEELVSLVERYRATEDLLLIPPTRSSASDKAIKPSGRTATAEKGKQVRLGGGTLGGLDTQKPSEARDRGHSRIQCWRCHEMGHIAANCPLSVEPMDCNQTRRMSLFARPVLAADGRKVGVLCIHGDTREYPTAVINLHTPCGTITHEVGVVGALFHEAIIGRDLPVFWDLWRRRPTSGVVADNGHQVCPALAPEPFEADVPTPAESFGPATNHRGAI
ncbi:hypothetical protein GDO81_019102 [Engystomops pustulosus]|uniref:CCHC-type domain-containing protein n=1 Tax=Engystomops pustulosus TaxID=76066 RepID=A0AAV6ZG29_ENGPU|nr:hypothetical protein GDO81_019102 [Engystomops pustulosus]